MKKTTSKNLATLSLVSILALSSFESAASTSDATEKTQDVTIRKETKKLGQNAAIYTSEKSKDTITAIESAFRTAGDKIELLGHEAKEKSKDAYDKLYHQYEAAKVKSADKAYAAYQSILAQLKKMNRELEAKIGRVRAER